MSRTAGFVCPRCRYRVASCVEPFQVCPRDRYAFVTEAVFAHADGDPLLGMTIAERYVVLGKIGRGATGTVYRAFDLHGQHAVALKILRGDVVNNHRARERIACEARVLASLTSPNVVRLLATGEFVFACGDELSPPPTSYYLAMEMLEGEPLSKRLVRLGRLSVDEALRWATHVLDALTDVHTLGIVHRDLTPNNVFLAREGDAMEPGVGKVVDFGLALFVHEVLPGQDAFSAVGTPRYMSPEQVRGVVLDGRSDLYAVGLLLFVMLTGKAPFMDDDAMRVMARHVGEVPLRVGDVVPGAGIPDWISDVVGRALAKDPRERPQTAAEFRRLLSAAPRDSQAEVGSTSNVYR